MFICLYGVIGHFMLKITFWRLALWRILDHKTVNIPQKLMRGRMLN